MNENAVIIPVNLDTINFDRQINQVEGRLEEIDTMLSKPKEFGLTEDEMAKLNVEAEKLNNKLIQLNKQQDKINKQGLKDFEKQMGGIGSGIEKATKKVVKMALAVFGIRSAFMFVRNSINTIANQDEQLKANIDYMKNAIAYTIEPIVRKIVDWAYQILQYVRYIIKAWFNYDIFKNANKNLKATNKSAKELKRTLASFDEVNILSSGNTSGTGNNVAPNIDLQADIQPPKWVQWIADNKDLILSFGVALGTVFGASAIGKILGNIGMLFGASGGKGLIGLKETLAFLATGFVISLVLKGASAIIKDLQKIGAEMDKLASKGPEILDLTNKITNNEIPEDDIISTVNDISKEIDELGVSLQETDKKRKNLWYNPWKQDLLESQLGNMRSRVLEYAIALEQLYLQDEKNIEVEEKFREALEKGIEAIENTGVSADILKEKLSGLTQKKYKMLIETKVDSTQLGELMTQISKSSLLNLPKNILSVASKLKSLTGLAKGGIIYPKLARGGIVNYPGRGIMYGGANIGEQAPEAIVPLTDSQQMELLGATIGKYITVNATIPVYAYNRQVDRQFRKIQNQDNFAGNR